MTYEYGTGQQGLNYPNPYKVENYVLSIRIVIFALAFMILLWLAKVDLDSGNHLGMAINLIGLIGFLLGAISSSYKLSRQIRVYFGRGQPSGLAQELKPGMDGVTASGQHIKEAIRQGALVVDTPPGNINGFLYSHRRDLIIAPKEVQFLTQHVFSNMIKLGVLLGLFALSSFFAMGNHAGGWLGLYFFLVTLFVVVEPLLQTNQTSISLNMNVFWSLFALSIIVPVGLIMEGRHLPDMSSYSFGAQSFLIILLTLAGELLCFHALKFQLESPTGITTAFAQDSVSFNAPPAQINLEIERELQKEWTAAIPNRSYLRQTPQINMGTNGHFSGQIVQETQPMVPEGYEEGIDFVQSNPRLSKLLFINMVSVVATLFSTLGILCLLINFHNNPVSGLHLLSWLPLMLGALSLSAYWIKITHSLWGRFDFESKLYIFEYEGNFNSAEMQFGNYLKDSVQARKDIINIESMTLRVWVTHLKTSVFGLGINSAQKPRRIISMVGLKDESLAWLNHLKGFTENQSMMLKPGSTEDFARTAALGKLNALAEGVSKHEKTMLEQALKNGTGYLPEGSQSDNKAGNHFGSRNNQSQNNPDKKNEWR